MPGSKNDIGEKESSSELGSYIGLKSEDTIGTVYSEELFTPDTDTESQSDESNNGNRLEWNTLAVFVYIIADSYNLILSQSQV